MRPPTLTRVKLLAKLNNMGRLGWLVGRISLGRLGGYRCMLVERMFLLLLFKESRQGTHFCLFFSASTRFYMGWKIVDQLTRLENIISNYQATPMSNTSLSLSRLKSSLINVFLKMNTPNMYQASPSSNFPQIDGSRNFSQPNLSKIQEECENCRTNFRSKTELDQHNYLYQFGCEDCGICFTSKRKV